MAMIQYKDEFIFALRDIYASERLGRKNTSCDENYSKILIGYLNRISHNSLRENILKFESLHSEKYNAILVENAFNKIVREPNFCDIYVKWVNYFGCALLLFKRIHEEIHQNPKKPENITMVGKLCEKRIIPISWVYRFINTHLLPNLEDSTIDICRLIQATERMKTSTTQYSDLVRKMKDNIDKMNTKSRIHFINLIDENKYITNQIVPENSNWIPDKESKEIFEELEISHSVEDAWLYFKDIDITEEKIVFNLLNFLLYHRSSQGILVKFCKKIKKSKLLKGRNMFAKSEFIREIPIGRNIVRDFFIELENNEIA